MRSTIACAVWPSALTIISPNHLHSASWWPGSRRWRAAALALTPERVRLGDLEVDVASRQVRRSGRAISLTAKEFALLELLLRHSGQVIDRSSITAHVWDNNHDPFANVLEVLVRRLRSKIDDGFEPKLIHTIRGAGYRIGPAT